ncbi:MAG: glycosyltransferase family 4 protein [Acidimicrobiales bacterium]|nr:glycosyltransferase family 4 protein [Acidimicrobiales bacterium]
MTDPPTIGDRQRKLLLCSLAVPWDGAPTTGLYNIDQAKALQRQGWEVEILKPIPRTPRWLGRLSPRARRWRRHPEHYEFDGVRVHSPRVWFSHAPIVRTRLARLAPGLATRWFRAAVQDHFDRHHHSFAPHAVVFHGSIPWAAIRCSTPRVFIEHSGSDVRMWESSPRMRRVIARSTKGATARFTTGTVLQRRLDDMFPGTTTQYLRNGAAQPTAEQLAATRPAEWSDRTTLLCAGTYQPQKGHRVLLHALADLPDDLRWHLMLVGEPPRSLSDEIDDLGLTDRIEVLPRMSQQDLIQLMVWADLFVLPSWDEAFGSVYAEALAAGTPIICTSDCGMAEEIEHRVHGWIVQPRDVASLRAALLESLETDLPAMGQAGRQLATERFSWDQNATTLAEALIRGTTPSA